MSFPSYEHMQEVIAEIQGIISEFVLSEIQANDFVIGQINGLIMAEHHLMGKEGQPVLLASMEDQADLDLELEFDENNDPTIKWNIN